MTSQSEQPIVTATEIVGRSWKSLRAALGSMTPLFASGFVAWAVVEALFFNLPDWHLAGMPRLLVVAVVLGLYLGREFLGALIAAPLAVAVHRFILLNQVTRGSISWRPPYTKFFVLWLLGLTLFQSLAGLLAGLVSAYLPGGVVFKWLLLIAFGAMGLSVALIFPAVAVEEPSPGWRVRITTSLKRSEVQFWLIFRALFLFGLLAAVAFLALSIPTIPVGYLWGSRYEAVGVYLTVLHQFFRFASIIVGAAAVSWVYALGQYLPSSETAE